MKGCMHKKRFLLFFGLDVLRCNHGMKKLHPIYLTKQLLFLIGIRHCYTEELFFSGMKNWEVNVLLASLLTVLLSIKICFM